MPTTPHDRRRPPPETAYLPEHLRRGLVCLEATAAGNDFLPTQKMRCACDEMDLGDWLKRQFAAARGGTINPGLYERMRVLGVRFPIGDARRDDSAVTIRGHAVPVVPYQSPDYTTYQRMVWEEAFASAFEAVTDHGVDLNRLAVGQFDKNSAALDQMLFNVRQAYQHRVLPEHLAHGFSHLGLRLDDEALQEYLRQPQIASEIVASKVARDLLDARGVGLDIADVLTKALRRT